jgi:tripartite motif-containing protein 71
LSQRGSGSDAKSSAVFTRVRWVGAFVVLLLVCSAVPVFAAEQAEVPSPESEKVEFTPRTSQEEEIAAAQVPDAADVYKALRESETKEKEREEWLASPEAIEQREDSLLAFGNLSAGESEQLLRAAFEPQLEALNGDPSRFLSDAQLVKPVDDSAAVVKDEGDGSLMDSTLPVRTEDENGELSKVDLTLEETPQGFKTDNALVDLALPASARGAIEVGDGGFAIAQAGALESPARRFGDKNLFYPEVLPHTDLMVASTSFGAELFNLLRSKDSPEEFRFAIEVPPGAELRSDGQGGAEVVREGETLTRIPKPWALDAQQTDVPVTLEVEGDLIVLNVAHREGDYARPILLDPAIIQDGNNWYEGKNLDLLTNGAWKWDSNNSNIVHDVCCWGGTKPGLLTNVWDAFYGPEQRGQWTYSTANGAVLIVHAWINPFLRVDNGCGSEEPHDYAGLWNPGDQWAPFLRDEAKKKQGAVTLAGWGQAAVIGMGTGAPGVWLACDRNLYAGGVALWLDDTWGPGITSAGVPSGSWFGDKAPTNISVSSWDEGLGVQYVKLLNEGKGVIAEERPNNCTGLYGSTCPTTRTSPFSGVTGKNKITGDSFGEGVRESSVTVSDPTGKTAEKFFTTKVDNSKPDVALSGQLAEATGEVVSFTEGEKPVSEGEDKLRLPVYNLEIKAKDGVWGTTDGKLKRSGVRSIEVWLDGTQKKVWEPNPSCPQTSCEMKQTYPLDLTQIDTAGSHKLKVIAKDFVGEEKVREIEFEYFPATGMKDEYVMHYFPLPSGQGNEEEEENPVRPELAVNVMNGNLVYRERDIDVDGTAGVDLEVERFYNSQLPDSENTEWGDGWTLAQTPDLEPVDTGGSPAPDEAELVDQSGALRERVELPSEAGATKFDSAMRATVTKRDSGGFEMTDETGESATSVVFDENGQTEARVTEGYAKVDYRYEGGDLAEIEVIDPATFAADPSELEIPKSPPPTHASSFGTSGTANGQFDHPADIALTANGQLLVADSENDRIQRFDEYGTYIGKFGSYGTGTGQFDRPSGIAIAPNGDILVAEPGNDRLQRFDASGKYLATIGSWGTGNGQFKNPEGIAVEPDGEIWVSDNVNDRVQKLSAQGAFIKVIGTSGPGDLDGPRGIDIGPEGQVVVADEEGERVVLFNASGEYLDDFEVQGEPSGLDVDAHGIVLVADKNNEWVERFHIEGGFLGRFGTEGEGEGEFELEHPTGVESDSEGRIWVTDSDNNRVQRWKVPEPLPTYASSFGTSGTANGQFDHPADIALTANGQLLVADSENDRIQRFDEYGTYIGKFGSYGTGTGQFDRPSGIAIAPNGDILVAEPGNDRLQRFDASGKYLATIGSWGTGNGQFKNPEGIAVEPDGEIWVSDNVNDRVQKLSAQGAFIKVIGTSGPGDLDGPRGIDIGPEGQVVVADEEGERVVLFNASGEYLDDFEVQGEPSGLDVDAHGIVLVADKNNEWVERFHIEGGFLGRFGTEGEGEGEFELEHPTGVESDSEGRIWVTDSDNNRVQRWEPPGTNIDLSDGDPEVEVETPGGLVSNVSGNAAGEHDYEHEGDLLVSHDGPEGETEYDYDGSGRLTKVTLPNGTWAEVDYEATVGRVEEVRVSIEGGPVKATEFEYTDQPARSTKVIPPDAPHIIYDIGDDGSVFRWWNVKKPPELDLEGALYDNRENPEFQWEGARLLEATAESAEGIASIETIVNGDTLVDEQLCPKAKVIECPKEESLWLTESDLHAPGHLQLEVIATDRLGESTSERFWVEVPKPTPLAPGTPVQPRFRDIAEFREDYGLEVVFPVANETELTERILDLIKAWNEPNTPAGQVARATTERWGVPLRPADVAELDYREWFYDVNAEKIDQWIEATSPSSYAGYYMDHPAGGVMHIGFIDDQEEELESLKTSLSLEAGERLQVYPTTPTASYLSVRATAQSVLGAIESNSTLADLVISVEDDEAGKATRVGTPNVAQVESILDQMLGANAPVAVEYEAGGGALLGGRYRNDGRIRAGDYINSAPYFFEGFWTGGPCTAGFGAQEKVPKPGGGGDLWRLFLLTAGHCAVHLGEEVWRGPWERAPYNEEIEYPKLEESEVGTVARSAFQWFEPGNVRTDGTAIRIKQGGIVPLAKWGWEGHALPTEPPGRARKGNVLCYSGAISKNVSCGKIVARSLNWHVEGTSTHLAGYWVRFPEGKRPVKGDSGSPVWNKRTGASIGLVSAGRPEGSFEETLVAPLLHPPNMPANRVPGILHHQGMAPLHLKVGG